MTVDPQPFTPQTPAAPVFADDPRTERRNGRRHLVWILLCAFVPIAGALMEVHEGRRVGLRGAPRFELPELCMAKRLGVPCPGCGLTRSIVHLMHGDVHASLAMHRFGWLIFALIVAQIPLRAWLWSAGRDRLLRSPCTEGWLWSLVIALLAANWLWTWLAT